MTLADVDVDFYPRDALSPEEREEWCRILACSLAGAAGALALRLVRDRDLWIVYGFSWFRPGTAMFHPPGRDEIEPLRTRAIEALRAAGKNVAMASLVRG